MVAFDTTDMLLPQIWASNGRIQGSKPALICEGEARSWHDFNANLNRLANLLRLEGLENGDRVAVLVSSSIAAVEMMCGTVKAGAVMVPVSGLLTSDQLRTLLNDCGASRIIVSHDLLHLLSPVLADLPALLPNGRFCTDGAPEGFRNVYNEMERALASEPDVSLSASDPYSIMYSSGTTGLPKGVLHSHSARSYFCVSNGFEMGFDSNSRGLVTTALYTAGTWLVVMPTLFAGGTLYIQRQFRVDEFLATLSREKITHTFTVPSQISMILAGPGYQSGDLSALKMMLSAGSPLRPDLKEALVSQIGARFFELYGFTEGIATLLRPADQLRKPLSVGTALMGQEVVTLRADGTLCDIDEPGEIAGRCPGLMRAYYGKPEATTEALWRDERGRSFVRSGDIGRIDADGFLYILDRKKDMIISGGLNIYPADIEAVVGAHPAILDVSVIGVSHEKWGETPLAIVVPREGHSPDEAELLAWCNARLAKHQRLNGLRLRPELPRNALGKVLKRDLRDMYQTFLQDQDQ